MPFLARLQKSGWLQAALAAWVLSIAVVCVRSALHPGLHSVFTEYRGAGAAWLGQGRLYGTGAGFVYSPLVAALFVPFAFMPAAAAEALWRALLGAGFLFTLWMFGRRLAGFTIGRFAALLLLVLPLALTNLNNGQANLVLVMLMLAGIGAAAESRWLVVAFCAAFAAYWKIYPLAFGLLLVAMFPEKLGLRTCLCLVALFALSLLLQKPAYVLHEYREWLRLLLSDNRQNLHYYGRNRDLLLVLRMLGLPLSDLGWKIVQLAAGLLAAAICVTRPVRSAPLVRRLFLAMSLAIVWMLLFGPATEAATYVMIAAPAAYLLIAGWSTDRTPPLRWSSSVAYGGFLVADMINSWSQIRREVYLVHTVQPVVTLCFCVALFFWWDAGELAAKVEAYGN